MQPTFTGRHYETGTIVNALAASGYRDPKMGRPYSEALALGASGGIAFGYFVFEYKGQLPHVALLPRNTFSPFERALDNLAVRRDVRETLHADKAEKNLLLELDAGNFPIVWADAYSLPHKGLSSECGMWMMQPMLVTGYEGGDFLIVDGPRAPLPVSRETLAAARGKIKKDRFRMAILDAPDAEALPSGLQRGIETCAALFLDKPPAGSPNNFGIAGMRHLAKMLTDAKNAKGWTRTFPPGPKLAQALIGSPGQAGVWGWIEQWGADGAAERNLFADFLQEAGTWIAKPDLARVADDFRASATLWTKLAEAATPDVLSEFTHVKELRRESKRLSNQDPLDSMSRRSELAAEQADLLRALGEPGRLDPYAPEIQVNMSSLIGQIADRESDAVEKLRAIIA